MTTKQKLVIAAIALLLIGIGGFFLYRHIHQPQVVTGESQQQAETAAGVELAAKKAQVTMLQSQLKDAAQQIAELKNKPPDTIIKTVPVEVIKTVEKEVQTSGADFAIVTDQKQPDKQVDLKEIEKLPADTTVNLNQYNVYAYKKIIRGVNVYPDWSALAKRKAEIEEITVDINKRITKDGKYIGLVAGYEFDDKKGKMGLRYSF